MNDRALVLGGGGVAGIAWTTGLLFGLSEKGVDLRDAELMLGTSAGAAVAAQLGSPLSLAELFQRQVDPRFRLERLHQTLICSNCLRAPSADGRRV